MDDQELINRLAAMSEEEKVVVNELGVRLAKAEAQQKFEDQVRLEKNKRQASSNYSQHDDNTREADIKRRLANLEAGDSL